MSGQTTSLLLYGGVSIVVPFQRETVRAYWSGALRRGERFINFNEMWVRTDLIYAIAAHRGDE
jgi:hypothetical protein